MFHSRIVAEPLHTNDSFLWEPPTAMVNKT